MQAVERATLEAYAARFGTRPDIVTSAPGRINLIGEHTDYNEGFVLPCAIAFRIASALGEGAGGYYSVEYAEEQPAGGCPSRSWADYPRGVGWAFATAGHALPRVQAAFHGMVPRGSGLSSSAALEASFALALSARAGLDLPRTELAVLCRRAENDFIGVKSGIMDQYASLLCRAGAALLIDCRSLESRPVPLDLAAAGLTLLVCDTRVERSLASSAYNDRREACERAAAALGLSSLRDAHPEDLDRLTGDELKRARHVVGENRRVLAGVEALERDDFAGFGRLMNASHASLRDDYEVSIPELDTFVTTVTEAGALGARLTGAGFGGCAIALVPETTVEAASAATREAFARNGFREPAFYRFLPSEGARVAFMAG
jgi:galactokinase